MSKLAKFQFRANTIVDFYCSHGRDRKLTVQHFKMQNIHRSIIYRCINRFEMDGDVKFKPKTGRPRSVRTPALLKKIDQALQKDPDASIRKLAISTSVSPTTIVRAKKDTHWRSFKKSPMADYNHQKSPIIKRKK